MSSNEDNARRELLERQAALLQQVEQSLTAQPTKPESIAEGEQIVAQVERYIRRFTILPAAAYLALVLWIIATYCFALFDCFPYLALLLMSA